MCDSSSESESQNLLFYLLINAQIASAIHFLGGFQGSLKNGTLRYIHSVRKLKQIIRINFVFLHCYSNTQMSILDPSELLPWVGWTEKCLYFSSMQNTQMENAEHYTGRAKTDVITFPQALPYSARPPVSCPCNSLVISVEPLRGQSCP